jgi:hypothetical protein
MDINPTRTTTESAPQFQKGDGMVSPVAPRLE